MKKLYLLILFLLIGVHNIYAQPTIEDFEDETSLPSTTFTSDGQQFAITSQSGQTFYVGNYFGTNCISNDASIGGVPSTFTIATNNSAKFVLKSFYISGYNITPPGTLTIIGKLAGNTVFTATASVFTISANLYHFVNMSTFGSQDNSNAIIDSFVVNGVNSTYLYMDTMAWQKVDIDPSVSSLSAFNSCPGNTSDVQSFTVSGNNLTADLIVTAPQYYEVSTSAASGYGNSINLSNTGTLPVTTIYVRLSATAVGTPSGNIELSSIGKITVNVGVTGSVFSIASNPPNRTICNGSATTFSISSATATSFQWQENTGSGFTNISDNTVYSGTTSNTLTIIGAAANINSHTFRAVASNGTCTLNSNAGTLTVSSIDTTNGNQTNVSCFGGTNGTATVIPSGGIVPYSYSWTPSGGTAATASGLEEGTYTVTITDNIGCTAARNFTITQPTAALTATADAQTNVSCNGGSNGSATVGVNGGTPGYTYSWAPSGGNGATASGLAQGTYIVTVTDANNCSTTQSFTITEPSVLTATADVQTNVSCNGGSNGSATVGVSGGTPGYTYSWAPSGGTAATASGLAQGTYIVTVTDSKSCTTTQQFTITEPSVLTATANAQTNVSCNGGSNGSATVAATGGTPGYTYSWAPSGGNGATASGLTEGTYIVTVTDSNSCTTTQQFTITEPSVLTATADAQTNVSCNGGSNGSATVAATGGTPGYTYSWTPSGGTGATASGLSEGTYIVTVTDANSCSTTQSFTITEPSVLTATAYAQTNVSCNGGSNGSATVAATGGTPGYTYSWAPSGGTGSTASGLAEGTYTVTVMDDNGCTATQSFTFTEPSILTATANAQTNVSCNGESNGSATVDVSGGTPGYTYSWAPSGGTASMATGLIAGTYIVTVTDANGCTATQSFTITEPPVLSGLAIVSQANVSCNGGSNAFISATPVTGGTGTITYDWTPGNPTGDGTPTISGLSAGTWTCTATDANGCTISDAFFITQPSVLTATTDAQTNVSCNGGSNGLATVNASGGTGTYTYSWAPTGGTAATASGLTAGTYAVTVTDANSCSTTQTFTITEPNMLTATADAQTNVSCNSGSNGSATVGVTGGTPGYTYSWAPSGGTGSTASGLAEGTYTVTVMDANGCTATQSFTITEPSILTATANAQTNISCNGESNGSAIVDVSGGTPGYTYSWAPSGGTASMATGLSTGTYIVTVTDANGCTATQSFTITEPPVLSGLAIVSQANVSCNGGSNAFISATPVTGGTGTITYDWTPGNPTGDGTPTISGLSAGTWTCTATDANGCTLSESFTITEPQSVTINADTQTNVNCNGGSNGSISVSTSGGTGAYTYLWAPSGGTGATASGLIAGTYTLTVTDANGCTATQSFTITEPNVLIATAEAQTNVSCNGGSNGSATVAVTGGTESFTYSWTPTGGSEATATSLAAGIYTVTVTDANGCTATQSFSITEPPLLAGLEIASQINAFCNNGLNGTASVTPATGGTGAITYDWTPGNPTGDGTINVTGLSTGTWVCTATDANGCTLSQSFTITEPSAITIVADTQTNVLCNGGSDGAITVIPTGGSPGYTYLWAPSGGTAATASNLATGIYIVTVTDANGCSSTQSFTITEPEELVTSDIQTDVLCSGTATGSATVTAIGGTAPYSYLWSNGGTTATNAGLAQGSYSVTVTDANGCIVTQSFTINEPEELITSGTQTDVLCFGSTTGSATVTATGGTAPYSYLWSNGGTTSTNAGLAQGSYSVTVTDANGCIVTQSFTINEPEELVISGTQTNVLCFGNATASATVTATGGTAPYSYLWSNGGTTATKAGLAQGSYSVIVTDANGCVATQSFTINEPQEFTASILHTDVLCNGAANGSATVTATGGTGTYTYVWNTTPIQTTATVSNLTIGTYTVNITDANGCTISEEVLISQPLAINIDLQPADIITSNGNDAQFTVLSTNADNYQWQISEDGENWTTIEDGGTSPVYSGATTNTLSIENVPVSLNGYFYRLQLTNGTDCTTFTDMAILTVSNVLTAINDDFSITAIPEGTEAVAGNVIVNDLFNNLTVTEDEILIIVIDDGGLTGVTIDTGGNLTVPATSQDGTYTIVYQICEAAEATNCTTAGATVVISPVTGTNVFKTINFTIYPNPASDKVFIKLSDFTSYSNIKATVYDLKGRLIRETNVSTETFSIDVTSLESAVYILNITSDAAKATKRIVVDKNP